RGWRLHLVHTAPHHPPPVEEFVISVELPGTAALENFRSAIEAANQHADERHVPRPVLGVGADLAGAETEYFCPANIDQLLFGDRSAAASVTGSRFLRDNGLTGAGVNVVVFDEGIDATKIPYFGGGWGYGGVQPGTTRRGHGPMVVRNILDAA